MLNVKHSENSERYKEKSKKKSFCLMFTAHLLVGSLSRFRMSVSVSVYMLALALVWLVLTHVLSVFPLTNTNLKKLCHTICFITFTVIS